MTLDMPPIQSFEEFEAETLPMLQRQFKFSDRLRARMSHEVMTMKVQRDWIVKGCLQARSFHLIIGTPGCGKSFLTLDLCMNLALAAVDKTHSGLWFGKKIKPCGVIYVAAEGQDDFVVRMSAWLLSKGLPMDTKLPFVLIPTAIDMRSSDADTKTLIEDIEAARGIFERDFGVEPGLLVIDTLNRSLAGGDDVKDGGAFIKNGMLVKEACRIATMPVHHTAKTGGEDPRGHGSLKGDNDGQWFVTGAANGAPNAWRVTRLKAGPTGEKFEFRIRPFEVGRDEDNDPITSCIVSPQAFVPSESDHQMRDAAATQDSGKPMMTPDGRAIIYGGNAFLAMKAAHQSIENSTALPPPSIPVPHGHKATTFKAWLDEMVATFPGENKDDSKFRDRCRKAQEAAFASLQRRGLIDGRDDWVWRTNRRVSGIDQTREYGGNSGISRGVSENDSAISGSDTEISGLNF